MVYSVCMTSAERRNLAYRLTSSFIILLNLGFDGFCMAFILMSPSENQVVSIIACIFAALMMIFEIVLFLRGGKKELALYKIAFNPNDNINNVPLVAVSVFAAIGVGFIVLGSLLNVYRHVEPNISSSFVILLVAVYLVSNCIIYFLFCLMFKKRKFKLEDLLK